MTILMAGGGTGGHVFPLLAVADAMRATLPELRLVFVGTERGLEKRVVPARGYELELMRVLPMRGAGARGALRGAASAMGAIFASRALLRRYAPKAVCSIGGYAAGPIALTARAARVPVALIEPNSVMGLSNRLLAPLVQRAYTAFAETERHFKRSVVLRTGVPLRSGFFGRPYPRRGNELSILVLGGSQGAKALNDTLPAAFAELAIPLRVVHQAGKDSDRVLELYRAAGLPQAEVIPFIEDMPAALARAELVVGRAGASAVSEICAIGRPGLLIPYPFAAGDHQLKNAEALSRAGACVCLPAQLASAPRIAQEINWLLQDERLPKMAERARECGRPEAARVVAEDLLNLAGCSRAPCRSVA
jgi:UDP-N-acetylglucosamine--N-acetylmuramyl-(pentapeptide) pyrophosphoryl-undecaprenol N-acetylglucosamine transferase